MSEQDLFEEMNGRWQGTKRLWLDPDEPALESGSTAEIEPVLQDRFVRLSYRWAFEGQAQEGWLIWPRIAAPGKVTALWLDSWHVGQEFLDLQGEVEGDGPLRVRGAYAVEPGPDWGWEIVVDLLNEERLQVLMYNITPQGERSLGVEIRYERVGK